MSSRHHIDDFMRGRIIGKIEEGRKITDVAREFDIAHSVVSRLLKSFKTTGMCSRRHGGGRVRSTTPAEDRYIVLSAKRNRRTPAQQVANHFLAASGKQISRKTAARRLRGGGLYARRLIVCVPLTRQHRTARLQWCREHHNWTEQDWACVLFSDESRFSLSKDCRRQLIWRESGTAYRPENIQEKDRYPTCSIMVWAGIMINGRTRLHVVANLTMTGQRYIDEVLLPHVRLFRGAVGDKFVFMDDNATCHRTLAVQDCLDSEGIQRLVWPARSPDLNPIENVWDALGRQVAGRNYPPTTKNTLIRALTKEWDKLPQQLLDNVVQNYVEDECTSPNKFQKVYFRLPSNGPESVGELQPNRFGTYSRTGRNCLLKLVPPDGRGIVITVLKVDFRNHEGCKDYIKTSRREDLHIVRNARVRSTASSAAIQIQVAPSLGSLGSSRTIRRHLAEGHLESRCPLRVLPLTPTHRRLRLEWCHARGNWIAAEWNQVVFSDESRFPLISDDNRVRVWRPHGELLNPPFALHPYTAPIAVVRVWGAIAYNARSPLVLIRGTMTTQWYVHDSLQPHVLPLMQRLPGAIFNMTILVFTRQGCHKTDSALLLSFLSLPDP
ncbi:transposable element Tcb2 transposase [Trichonephila clavipes]|nr:transposable element Tcb2 transposase [Trichonephila clavipes]